jgi:tetratricopeptide (TPR) repeat protein
LESQSGSPESSQSWLQQAATTSAQRVFASRPEEIPILGHAIEQNSSDGQARLQLGCLLASLGRVEEATAYWREAARAGAGSIAWRNLGLVAAVQNDLEKAEQCFRRAIAARPNDQTLYRDLAEILIADQRRAAAIELLEAMPLEGPRRAELTVILAESYVAEERFEDCVKLLESLPYFVNWEGQDVTWRLFNRAHIGRGRLRLEKGDAVGALADFEAALTYPANLNVGRSNQPIEAPAQFWRGKALSALHRPEEAKAAWKAGAGGADVAGWQNEHREKCRRALEEIDG